MVSSVSSLAWELGSIPPDLFFFHENSDFKYEPEDEASSSNASNEHFIVIRMARRAELRYVCTEREWIGAAKTGPYGDVV